MKNPWEEIDLTSYEKHMSLDSVFQLQMLNEMMKSQFYSYPIKSVMILGVAGGNGLEHIDTNIFTKVYGVDINESYLKSCISRYPELNGVLDVIKADLTQDIKELTYADLLIANLFIEYVGYECFQRVLEQVKPKYISCIIQKDNDISFVSNSPYIHVFDRLDEVHHQIDESTLLEAVSQVGYKKIMQTENELPNEKRLVRIDFGY
ncbi:MAG: methyltransferase type 11 [Lachnospiraceae bacterium]|nr:methyltransferase type 11 [Lachnospiraceae bacterium]